ncbi:hypothetical protein ACDQ55_21305 [Chitinophaga sp. 30R24]|uniref:hypothetical protein n=1 Tax=Chitinophaga sp. 30R24 TaxID=3248838 RepID=UPI003B90839E
MTISRDSERVSDKKFVIQVPQGLQNSKMTTNNYFLHLLNFKGGQKIVLLYQPFDTIGIDKQNLNLSYADFEILCSKVGLLEKLNGIEFMKNRLFGLKVIGKEKFFVIYLNVKNQEVDVYNYAINSLTLTSKVN